MLLRPGSAGSNTVASHLTVLTDVLARIADSSSAKLLIRVGGAAAAHGLRGHLIALNTRRRRVRFTVGRTITDTDEAAIARLPGTAWEVTLNQDGTLQEDYGVAELSGLSARASWGKGLRLTVRRVKPSNYHLANLSCFEKKTGFKYSVIATSIRTMTRIPPGAVAGLFAPAPTPGAIPRAGATAAPSAAAPLLSPPSTARAAPRSPRHPSRSPPLWHR
ncbi:hypothetical protein ACIQWN_32295 [Streptomyces vinaceus]|uniref:hypothetical protein n=1 Tax=Streptomyces vinaceus TaxID=1960 RepID=UPI00382CFBE5